MRLPDDITGLIFSYVSIRKLANWVRYSDIFEKPISSSYWLENPACIEWALSGQGLKELFSKLSQDEFRMQRS